MLVKLKSFISNSFKRRVKLYARNCIQSILYYVVEDCTCRINKPCHIVIVCKGNVCRSVFAEYYLRHKVKDDKIVIESCGLDVNQGKYAPEETIEAAKKYDLNLSTHTSKGLHHCNIEKADLILAMEFEQYQRLVALFPDKRSRIKLLRKFAPFPLSLFCNIDDPYGYASKEYIMCYSLIDSSLQGLSKKYSI